MPIIRNNTPRVILNGIKDESVEALVPESEQVPQHLPLVYLMTERGPDTALCGPGDLTRLFGEKTFDVRDRFYYHQTLLAQQIAGEGNSVMVKRVAPEGALPATMTLALAHVEVVDTLNPYTRNGQGVVAVNGTTGLLETDAPGNEIPTGIKLYWALIPTIQFYGGSGFDDTTPVSIDPLDPEIAGAKDFYPIMTFSAPSFGDYGNNVGFRLWPAHVGGDPANPDVISANDAIMLNAQFYERSGPNSSGSLQQTLFGETTVEFMMKPGAYDPNTDITLTEQRLVDEYSDDGISTGTSPTIGPVGTVIFSRENYLTVANKVVAAELANVDSPYFGVTTELSPWMIDLFTGIDYNTGNQYYTVQRYQDTYAIPQAVLDLGLGPKLNGSSTHWLTGGGFGSSAGTNGWDETVGKWFTKNHPGDVGPTHYGIQALMCELVNTEMEENSWEIPEYPLKDSAQYPFSVIYDSGYCMEVKESIIKATSFRQDIHVTISTFEDAGEEFPQSLTTSEEASIGASLSATAKLYAESALHGTGPVRITIFGQSGLLINSPYKRRLPLTIEAAVKRARYMGAGNGAMKAGLSYDNYPLNTITLFKDVSSDWMSKVAKENVWSAGVNFVQFVDRSTLQFPGLQTVYAIKNSVLTSEVLMQIAVDVTKQAEIVWRRLTGNTDLTQEQFIERSNDTLLELVDGRYDNRVTIVPNTYFTPADEARGYSWVLDVAIYGNIMNTVGQVNVIMRRASALAA